MKPQLIFYTKCLRKLWRYHRDYQKP